MSDEPVVRERVLIVLNLRAPPVALKYARAQQAHRCCDALPYDSFG
jgi:hypothetical protein